MRQRGNECLSGYLVYLAVCSCLVTERRYVLIKSVIRLRTTKIAAYREERRLETEGSLMGDT